MEITNEFIVYHCRCFQVRNERILIRPICSRNHCCRIHDFSSSRHRYV